MKTIDEDRKERLSRGSVEVKDGEGGGFAQHEDHFANPGLTEYLKTDPELHRQLLEIEARQHDQKVASQHQEAAVEMFEDNMNQEAVRECKWLRQDELREFIPGRMMTSGEFLGLLRKIRPDATYNQESILGRRGLCVQNPVRGKYYFVTTVQDGMMIEWTQMRYDEHDIPTNERYHGWRSVLMTLIQKEIITIEESDAVFGKPTGERSNRWYRQLYIMRNARCPDCLNEKCTCKNVGDSLRADKYAYGVQ
jgi:hypothetical protein